MQVGSDRFAARALTASPEDRPRLWGWMVAIWLEYDRYQASTERDIPVVVLVRLAGAYRGLRVARVCLGPRLRGRAVDVPLGNRVRLALGGSFRCFSLRHAGLLVGALLLPGKA
ncbi:MAG: nitroreductase/quinone reductase family protein, partial [bacterium]